MLIKQSGLKQSGFKQPALKSKGNMAEYILPTALIGVTLVGGLSWLLMDSNGQQALLQSAQGEDIQVLQNGKKSLLVRQFGKNPNDVAMRINLPNGKQFVLKNVPNSPALSVEVDGVNGTTTKILASLEALIREMEKNGADPNTVSALKNLASKGYLLADDQKILETTIAGCGESKQCVQQKLFGNQEMLTKLSGLTLGSCANAVDQVCNEKRMSENGQEAMTPKRFAVLDQLWPGFVPTIEKTPDYNFSQDNLYVGKQLGRFLDAFHGVNSSSKLSPEVSKLVGYMSQSIFQLSMQSANNSGTVGTITGYQDYAKGEQLTLGSSPNILPTEYASLVAKQLRNNVPNLETLHTNSLKTENSATVICTTGNGTKQGSECKG